MPTLRPNDLKGNNTIKQYFTLILMLVGHLQFTEATDYPNSTQETFTLELLSPNEYKTVESFFTDCKINTPILYSILENKGAGKIFVDSKVNPSFVLVQNPASYTFLEGNLDQSSLYKVLNHLKTFPATSLICPLDWKYRSFFEKEGFTPVERIQLQRPFDLLKIDSWKKHLPSQYSLNKIGNENFDRCNWNSLISKYYSTDTLFFKNGIGFCILNQGKVISESYGLLAKDRAEIGVITDENYRGQSLGAIVCAFTLDYCYQNNLEPFWSCNASNPASASVAKKLGFQEDCRYFFLKWSAP